MKDKFTDMPRKKANIDFATDKILGELCFDNHSYGIGGVNSMPMPESVVNGMKRLKPKLIRIFIQEFFFIESDDGSLDFTKLDAYMKAVNDTGSDVMASICIKPHSLYPVVDETIWKPNDIVRWQYIIHEMVKRYSVENKYVTHWGVGNEMNIGEYGGCPYKINDVNDYYEYYLMTIDPILKAYPTAKIGGPSFAGVGQETFDFFDNFIAMCTKDKTQLDFVSYNIYSDNPAYHADSAVKIESIVNKYNDKIEVYVTEMNIGIGGELSIEEKAYTSKRASGLASAILEYRKRAPKVGTFQYHIYDQFCDSTEFAPFYSRHRYMANHWDDEPHRLGLFDLDGNARTQYYMYSMLQSMAKNEAPVETDSENIKIVASQGDDLYTLFLTNYEGDDSLLSFYFKNAKQGKARLTVCRIDDDKKWCNDTLSLIPTEDRTTYLHEDFWFSIYVPADSCAMITIKML